MTLIPLVSNLAPFWLNVLWRTIERMPLRSMKESAELTPESPAALKVLFWIVIWCSRLSCHFVHVGSHYRQNSHLFTYIMRSFFDVDSLSAYVRPNRVALNSYEGNRWIVDIMDALVRSDVNSFAEAWFPQAGVSNFISLNQKIGTPVANVDSFLSFLVK